MPYTILPLAIHHLRDFDSLHFFRGVGGFSPKRGDPIQPGQRPGNNITAMEKSPERASQSRANRGKGWCALSGL
jgi:hypothetical protein